MALLQPSDVEMFKGYLGPERRVNAAQVHCYVKYSVRQYERKLKLVCFDSAIVRDPARPNHMDTECVQHLHMAVQN